MAREVLKRAVETRTADTDWKPGTSQMLYQIEMINAPNPNRPKWTASIGRWHVIDSRTHEPWAWTIRDGPNVDLFHFYDLDFAQKICDQINEFGYRRIGSDSNPKVRKLGEERWAARVIVFTQLTTRSVVYDPKSQTHPVDTIPDDKIEALIKAPDLAFGRSLLKDLWP